MAAYEAFSAELLSYAAATTRDADSARDAVQDVFLRLFVELSYGRPVRSPRAWLYRVLRNLLLDRLDTAASRREGVWADAHDVQDRRPGPESLVQQAQLAQHITGLLTEREMECIRLRAEGLSYSEMADVLGIRPGTVSALLTRAHKKLLSSGEDQRSVRSRTAEALYFLFRKGGSHPS